MNKHIINHEQISVENMKPKELYENHTTPTLIYVFNSYKANLF